MGTIYGLKPRTGRWALDCGECGKSEGTTRKRHCPEDWCSFAQLCPECFRKIKTDGRWHEWHKDCKAQQDAYRAAEAAKDAEGYAWARSAWGDWDPDTPEGMVRVLTRAGTTVYVRKEDYQGGNVRLPAYALVAS